MATDRKLTVTEPGLLLPFLLQNLPEKGRNKVKALLTHRQVAVDDQVITRHDHALLPGQSVSIRAASGFAKAMSSMEGVRILYEDTDIVVIDKPPGLLSIASEEERERTAYHVLTEHVRVRDAAARIFIVHRLDRNTSGVMLFAKRYEVQQALQLDWRETVLERSYVAVVEGLVNPPEGTLRSWLKETKTQTMYVSPIPGDGQEAITHYQVLKAGRDFSLLKIWLETGRKNQIRVQLQSIGHSVVGDKRYGAAKNTLGRLGLHARVLSFRHPVTHQVLRFETDIPPAFRKLLSGAAQ